jgi:hypothetical protein
MNCYQINLTAYSSTRYPKHFVCPWTSNINYYPFVTHSMAIICLPILFRKTGKLYGETSVYWSIPKHSEETDVENSDFSGTR